jgi:hypothetical protein
MPRVVDADVHVLDARHAVQFAVTRVLDAIRAADFLVVAAAEVLAGTDALRRESVG